MLRGCTHICLNDLMEAEEPDICVTVYGNGEENQMAISVDNRLQQERRAKRLERRSLFSFSSLSPFSG